MGRKALETKKVGIAPLVQPETREGLKALAAIEGRSQGEVLDDLVYQSIEMFATDPLEEDETLGPVRVVTAEMIERALKGERVERKPPPAAVEVMPAPKPPEPTPQAPARRISFAERHQIETAKHLERVAEGDRVARAAGRTDIVYDPTA